MYVLVVFPSPKISLNFALRLAIFELQAILRQVQQMTPKWSGALQGQKDPIYVLLLSPIPNFSQFRSTARHCWVTSHFEKKLHRIT